MSEPAFTPAPWVVQDERDGSFSIWAREPHTHCLAVADTDDESIKTDARANAYLMRSAPRMWFALRSVRDVVDIARGDADPEVAEAATIALGLIDATLAEAQP